MIELAFSVLILLISSAIASGTEVAINTVVDPAVIGGVRVQIANDVIDASVSTRLADLRQRLAG